MSNMIPIVFINSRSVPYVSMIIEHKKIYETRSRNVLKRFADNCIPFLIAETGKGKPLVKCSACIKSVVVINDRKTWNMYRKLHSVPAGSSYDWKKNTKKKYLYELCDIVPVPVPFRISEGKRHGRTWMEYERGCI